MRKGSNRLGKLTSFVCMSAVAVSAVLFAANITANDAQAASSRYKLVWSDEFNGTKLNTDNWNYNIGNGGEYNGNPGWGNNEQEYYTDREENVKVGGGNLQITAIAESYEGYSYTSGRLNSSNKQNFKYGKVEARIKLPAISGLWPAFWMMGDGEGWPMCGEIDILETWNTDPIAQGAFHWNDGDQYIWNQTNKYRTVMRNGNATKYKGFDKTQYHVYGMEWDGKTIKYLVDDVVYGEIKVTDAMKDEMENHYFILLNMAVGGNLTFGAPIDEAKLPATMYVDYVRVYQLTNSNAQYTKKWTEQNAVKKHTVKLTDGSKTVLNSTVYDGETVVIPTLTKKGYLFEGFYYTNSKGKQVKITSNSRIKVSVAAKAKWTKVKVKKAKITSIKAGKKMAKLKFSTSGGAKGYQIKYSTKKSVKGGKTISVEGKSIAIPKLKSGKKYYFKARAYKLDSKKKKVYGAWSKVKSVKVK